MDKGILSKTVLFKKWSLLRILIIVLGNFVIFGLGFALGLNYAQNLYFVKKRFIANRSSYKEDKDSIVKTPDEFSFFYELKNSEHDVLKKSDKNIISNKNKKSLDTYKFHENKDVKPPRNILTHDKFGYTIQLYSFKSKDVSEKKVSELKKKGYSAYQSIIDFGNDDIYYRVRIGQFKNRVEAARVLEKIFNSETKDAYITRN